jgi:glycosyltransferase involved in cell wall biosynthesis
MASLSVLIASRNEMFLLNTIEDIRKNKRGDTDIIVILDGQWPVEPIPDYPDVHLVYMPTSIGQRAAVNMAARISRADYVMKLDAHCSVGEGFDVAMMDPYEKGELDRDVTSIPRLYNLHVFDWICDTCGKRTYQGPTPVTCPDCKGAKHHRDIVWTPRWNRMTDAMRFDSNLHFNYWSQFRRRPEAQSDLTESMGNLGACFLLKRDRYFELEGLDELYGYWGSVGSSLSCKSWLSGGRQVINKRTFYSHLFRTQGGDFSFPYRMTENQAEHARKRLQKIWLNNAWPKQTRSLLWLVEHFKPAPDWHDPSGAARLAQVVEADAAFTLCQKKSLSVGREFREVMSIDTDTASPAAPVGSGEVPHRREQMSIPTMSLPGLLAGDGLSSQHIDAGRDNAEMHRVDTMSHVTDVVDHRTIGSGGAPECAIDPGEHNGMHEALGTTRSACGESHASISGVGAVASPQPASSLGADADLGEDARKLLAVQMGNGENAVSHAVPLAQVPNRLGAAGVSASAVPHSIPRSGVVYYSDNHLDPPLADACRSHLKSAVNGHPLVSVTLKPVRFGMNLVLNGERSRLSMFKQVLAGLEALDTDIAFLAEHDCLYHPSCFQFVPPRADRFYYNQNVWRVNADTGQAVTYDMMSVSGCCANRLLLVDYYRKVVADVEANGYDHAKGYEAGVKEGLAVGWRSEVPYVDIRHGHNLTQSRWSQEEFRDKSTCQNWQTADTVPGWGDVRPLWEAR